MGKLIAFGGLLLAYFVAICALLFGWVLNLIEIVHAFNANTELSVKLVLRIVGVFAVPLGGVLGYF